MKCGSKILSERKTILLMVCKESLHCELDFRTRVHTSDPVIDPSNWFILCYFHIPSDLGPFSTDL